MSERYPGYLFSGTPVSSWDRGFNSIGDHRGYNSLGNRGFNSLGRGFNSFDERGFNPGDRGFDSLADQRYNSLENQLHHQYRGRASVQPRRWGSMSEGGGLACAGDNSRTNLIVNYLPQTMTEKDLYAMFMTVGPIESCRVMKDFKTGYSYGFGFVNFTREEDATRAIDMFNGYQLRNKRLKVSYARPSGDDIKDTNLYVTNLPRAVTEEQLETIFGKYGRIVQKHILRDKSSGTPRGVAFVRFDKREEAQEAIAALNNVIPEGGSEPLSVKPVGADGQPRRGGSLSRSRSSTPHDQCPRRPVRTKHADCVWEPPKQVAEEHGKQKAAYYAGWAAGFHHNRAKPSRPRAITRGSPHDTATATASRTISFKDDFSWGCHTCPMMPDPWEQFPPPPMGGSHPSTPRNGACHRPGPGGCPNSRVYPNYIPGKNLRPNRGGRNPPWAPGFGDERFKGQRCRNGPAPYW